MYKHYSYEYISKHNGHKGVLLDDKMTIYDPNGNIIYQVDWHCGEDWYSKECCRIRTEDYPMLIQRLKKLEEDIKDEFGIDG